MPVDRPDHLAGIRRAPTSEPPEGTPVVRPDLVEWVEAWIGPERSSVPHSLDQAMAILAEAAYRAGQLSVVALLKTGMVG